MWRVLTYKWKTYIYTYLQTVIFVIGYVKSCMCTCKFTLISNSWQVKHYSKWTCYRFWHMLNIRYIMGPVDIALTLKLLSQNIYLARNLWVCCCQLTYDFYSKSLILLSWLIVIWIVIGINLLLLHVSHKKRYPSNDVSLPDHALFYATTFEYLVSLLQCITTFTCLY